MTAFSVLFSLAKIKSSDDFSFSLNRPVLLFLHPMSGLSYFLFWLGFISITWLVWSPRSGALNKVSIKSSTIPKRKTKCLSISRDALLNQRAYWLSILPRCLQCHNTWWQCFDNYIHDCLLLLFYFPTLYSLRDDWQAVTERGIISWDACSSTSPRAQTLEIWRPFFSLSPRLCCHVYWRSNQSSHRCTISRFWVLCHQCSAVPHGGKTK